MDIYRLLCFILGHTTSTLQLLCILTKLIKCIIREHEKNKSTTERGQT